MFIYKTFSSINSISSSSFISSVGLVSNKSLNCRNVKTTTKLFKSNTFNFHNLNTLRTLSSFYTLRINNNCRRMSKNNATQLNFNNLIKYDYSSKEREVEVIYFDDKTGELSKQ